MGVLYDAFTGAFLDKITEYDLRLLTENARQETVDGYMKRAYNAFRKVCRYDLSSAANDETREYEIEIDAGDLDEIIDIVSEGMLVQWLKPYVYRQDLLENVLNTRDYTEYSPGELLRRVGDAYKKSQKDYKKMIRDYSYDTADLTRLHS